MPLQMNTNAKPQQQPIVSEFKTENTKGHQSSSTVDANKLKTPIPPQTIIANIPVDIGVGGQQANSDIDSIM